MYTTFKYSAVKIIGKLQRLEKATKITFKMYCHSPLLPMLVFISIFVKTLSRQEHYS